MAKYTFIVGNSETGHEVELPDDDAAWSALVTFAGELLRDLDGHLQAGRPYEISVFDEGGDEVAAAALETRRRTLTVTTASSADRQGQP